MPEPDTLAGLAEEFRALSGRRQRSVLDALTAVERAKLKALLAEVPTATAAAEPDDGFDTFSPWLSARLRDEPATGADGDWKMTLASQRLLRQAAQEMLDGGAGAVAGQAAGRATLVGALGGLLSRGLAR